jgi:hypothetical protein
MTVIISGVGVDTSDKRDYRMQQSGRAADTEFAVSQPTMLRFEKRTLPQ